jgi:Protein of unknown function (DUF3108)
MKIIHALAVSLALLLPIAAGAAELKSNSPSNVESFRYSWRLRGGLSWIAGLVFPRTGLGALKTTFPPNGEEGNISSELLITSPAAGGKNGFYVYQSEMDESGTRTLMTYHGYAWGSRSRKERTVFDYVRRLAHLHKETPTKVEDRVKPMPAAEFRDILTAIYFLRQHADEIRTPIATTIYSDGKQYAVVFRPVGRAMFTIGKDRVPANGFEVVGAPGGERRWSGGVTVWVSDDARRIPCRIEISETLASLQLDLQTVESYAVLKP